MLDLASTYPHVPVDDMLRRIKRDDEGRPRKHVLIAGAEMTGLVAARELQALRHTARVVEGSGRTGGHVLTHRFEDGSYNELGAMRAPASHDYTRHYLSAAGLDDKLITFVDSTPENFLDLRGTGTRAEHGQRNIFPLYGLPGERTLSSETAYPQSSGGAILSWLYDNVVTTLTKFEQDSLFRGELNTDRLRALDALSLGAFLDGTVPGEVKRLVGAYTSLAVWYHKALTMFIRDQIVQTGDGLLTLIGGMDQLPDAIAAELAPSTVERGAEVTRIAVKPDHSVEVDLATHQGHRRERADHVLCTLPFGVMRQLALEELSYEELSYERTYAIGQMTFAASTKVILGFKHRFWEPNCGIYGGSSVSDGLQRQTYYPMDHIGAAEGSGDGPVGIHGRAPTPRSVAPREGADASEPGALLGASCWGPDAVRLGSLPPERCAHAVRLGVARFHPEVMDDAIYTGHASMCWGTNRWSVGAFAFLQPGQLGTVWAAAGKPEGRLSFAGEHRSLDQGWIQGTLIPSLQAVDQSVNT